MHDPELSGAEKFGGGGLSPTLFKLFQDDMTGYLNPNNGVGIGKYQN